MQQLTEQSIVLISEVVISNKTVLHSAWSLTEVSLDTALFSVSIPVEIKA